MYPFRLIRRGARTLLLAGIVLLLALPAPSSAAPAAIDAAPQAEATTTTLTASRNPATVGEAITFSAAVTSTLGLPTGVVTFTLDSATAVTRTLAAGLATYSAPGLPVGSHTVRAAYGGDDNFAPSVSADLVQVVQPLRIFLPVVGRRWPAGPWALRLNPIEVRSDYTVRVSWSADPEAAVYLLQEASNAAFAGATTVYLGGETSWQSSTKAPGTYCYRVQGQNPQSAGPWSDVQCVELQCRPTLADDFSNPASGWPAWDHDVSTGGYVDGEYRIIVKQEGYLSLATPGRPVDEFRAAVDGRAAGHTDGGYGIVFHNGASGFYIFEVAYGKFVLTRYDRDSSNWVDLIGPTANAAIRAGNETNRLEVEYVGGRIRLWANGALLGQVYDDRHPSGTVGVVADAGANNFEARFDNFALYQQPCVPAAAACMVGSPAASAAAPEQLELQTKR